MDFNYIKCISGKEKSFNTSTTRVKNSINKLLNYDIDEILCYHRGIYQYKCKSKRFI